MLLPQILGAGLVVIALTLLSGCTPQTALLMQALPDGTLPVLLGNLQTVGDGNRTRLAELERRGDWSGMIRLAEDNLAADRSNADWWLVAGYANSRLGRHRESIRCYSELRRLAPDDMEAWNLLAQSYRAAGEAREAIRVLDNALRIRRDAAATWFLMGESYRDIGRYDASLGAYREAVRLENRLAPAWFGMGYAYEKLGRKQELEEVMMVLRQLDPALSEALGRSAPDRH